MSLPLKRTEPAVGSIRRSTRRPVVDLPQPDSPTSASVSPRRDLEAHVVDGAHQADRPCGGSGRGVTREMLDQAVDLQDRDIARATSLMTPARPAPSSSAHLMAGRDVAQRRRLAARQRRSANGQRGAKRQPVRLVVGLGTVPSMVASRSRSTSMRGIEPSRPIV